MPLTVALIGAAGAMGTRISNALRGVEDYRVLYVETPDGEERLRERGDDPTPRDDAASEADIVVLAVPDHLVGFVANEILTHLRPGTIVVCLDPAAPYADALPARSDITYFVTHPAHPPIFNDETDEEARRDYWGNGKAKQSVVSALMQGPEEHYTVGEAFARAIFRPILRSHRVTVEQMALLEPALSETVAATCITVMREAMDEVVRRGVPAEAARDFLLGHITTELAIVFDEIDWEFSAGAKQAIRAAKSRLFRDDWKHVLTPFAVRASVQQIADGPSRKLEVDASLPTYGYSPVVAQLTRLKEPSYSAGWHDYSTLGIARESVPELIRMLEDERWATFDDSKPESWAHIHALRALGQLRAEEAIPALLRGIWRLNTDERDDRFSEDAPRALAMIGPVTQPALIEVLCVDDADRIYASWSAGDALVLLAREYPETREATLVALTQLIERFEEFDDERNAVTISLLASLGAVEALPLIQRVFDEDRAERTICGDYDDVGLDMASSSSGLGIGGEWGVSLPEFFADRTRIVTDPTPPSSRPRKQAKRKMAKASRKRNRKR